MGALLLVSLSLGLSNFAAAISIGLVGLDVAKRARTALAFGFFEAAMPVVGLVLGQRLGEQLGGAGHYLGAALLILTGLYVMSKAIRQKQIAAEYKATEQSLRRLLATGFALSTISWSASRSASPASRFSSLRSSLRLSASP